LFDIDERLVDLMDQVEEAVAEGGEVSEELVQKSMTTWKHSERR
jgi:hypothetical protein